MKRGKREAKRAYGLGRRFLAMFLAMVMCTSMLQLTAFATTYENQVMPGYYTVDANGTVGTTTATSVTEDGFTLKKEITQTGKDAFDITLTVETSQTVTTSHSKAATVLVIDLSNSMKNAFGSSTRMAEARNVAKQFLASYAGTDPNAEQYISVVWFGTNSGVDKDWVNVAGGEGHNSYDEIFGYLDTMQAPHSSGEPFNLAGGTNLDSGLTRANAQLAERASIDEQKNVVVITDGKPTFYLKDDGSRGGDGSNCNATVTSEAADAAALIKESATLYTVCLAAEDDVCYTGASITVCRHCEQTQDKHTKVTSCDNCGETKEQHDSFRWNNRTYYVCSDAEWPYGNNEYYDEETTLYCANGKNTYSAKTVSGSSVTVGYFLSNDIATSASTAFNASTTASLQAALAAIAGSIDSNGYTGEGTFVTDPMGEFINLGVVNIEGVTVNGDTLTWTLNPEQLTDDDIDVNGDTTTYTYTITYPITLDTAAEGFKETENGSTKYYPTNGYTYLSVPQTNGSTKPIAFLVPGVCGEIPEYNWTVEYYLEQESSINKLDNNEKDYVLAETVNKGTADLHSTVYAPEGFENYKNGYTFAKGDMSTVITTDESKYVIRLYYNLNVAPVTVKHYYKTTTIAADGTQTVGEYELNPIVTSKFAVVGKVFRADEQMTYGGITYDKVDKVEPSKSIHISATNENLIEFYYSRVNDLREPTTAQVDHYYTLTTYELGENGKYVQVTKDPIKVEKVQYNEGLLPGTVYPVSAAPDEDHEGYDLDTTKGDYTELLQANESLSFVIKPADVDNNVRELYFKKSVDPREAATVTVNHHYTKNITAIVDGEVVNYNNPDGAVVTQTFNADNADLYKGERFVVVQVNDYQNETYNSAETNASKLVIEEVKGGEVIDLYYTLSEAPQKTSIVVNHYWRTFTEVAVEIIDPETGAVTGNTTDIRVTETHSEKDIVVEDLYVGQEYIAPKMTWGEGYDFNSTDSKDTGIAGTDRVLNLYYDKWTDDVDERRDAVIEVQHVYTTKLTTIVDGEVKTITVPDGTVTEVYDEYTAGYTFVATPETTYNRNEYDQKTTVTPVVLQPGNNGTIVINYEREDEQLDDASYTVNYEYRTYTMSINSDGVAGYWTAPEVTTDAVSGEGYVGQKIVLDAKAKADEGFAPQGDNPDTVQYLSSDENSWKFTYEKKIPLEKGTVLVNHHYTTKTIAADSVNGEPTSNTSTTSTSVKKYVGERYIAEADLQGFTLVNSAVRTEVVAVAAEDVQSTYTITVINGTTIVDFYYEKTNDLRVPVTYSIAHEYYLYDWDGSLISESKPTPVTATGFKDHLLVVAPEETDYELISATYNGEELEDYNIILQEGKNEIVFVYKKTMARDFVEAKVIHNFYKDEAAMNAEDAIPEKQFVEKVENLPERSEFSAEKRNDEGYVFHSAIPDTMKIVVTEKADENVIIINYIRATAEYEVIHIYNRNGVEEGRTTDTLEGLDGDVILADSIERVPVYEGKTYTFQSITGDITLDAEAKQTITLTYNRTTGGGGGGGGGTVIIPEPPVPQDPAPQPEPEVVIPEEDVPQVDIPEEDVPMADVPKTNDASALWLMMSVLSGSGLAGMAFLGRKKRDEEN